MFSRHNGGFGWVGIDTIYVFFTEVSKAILIHTARAPPLGLMMKVSAVRETVSWFKREWGSSASKGLRRLVRGHRKIMRSRGELYVWRGQMVKVFFSNITFFGFYA